jgi:hypothetical protein
MRIRIGIGHPAARISAATLLAVGAVALAIPRGDVTGQNSIKTAEQSPPLFTAIDLTPRGLYDDAHAVGISGEQQVGDAHVNWTTHALLWRSSAASMVDLNPGGFGESKATGICGNQLVGRGTTIGKIHALLWPGSAGNVVDLTPSGFDAEVLGTSGDQQVGDGSSPRTAPAHALLWRDSAASMVDLHPRGFVWSKATGVSGGQQVGMGELPSTTGYRNEHALLWRGSAASVVDLNPTGFAFSEAWGVGGGQQVGTGVPMDPSGDRPAGNHALLWRGSAASVVDLGPGFAAATNGVEQVGSAGGYAVLWRGSAASMMDLHAFLPPGFQDSGASAIDANGNVVGSASPTGGPAPDWHAFLWRRNVPKSTTSQEQSAVRCK